MFDEPYLTIHIFVTSLSSLILNVSFGYPSNKVAQINIKTWTQGSHKVMDSV